MSNEEVRALFQRIQDIGSKLRELEADASEGLDQVSGRQAPEFEAVFIMMLRELREAADTADVICSHPELVTPSL